MSAGGFLVYEEHPVFPSCALLVTPQRLCMAPPALLACSSAAVKAALNIDRAAPGTELTSITGLLSEGRGCLSKVKQ